MARDHIAELQDKIAKEFTLLASVVLARSNRFLESAQIPVEERVSFVGAPVQTGLPNVCFYDVVEGDGGPELPAVILFPALVMHKTKEANSREYGELLLYLDKVQDLLVENAGALHPHHYDLDYGDRYMNSVGIGVNLPITDKTAMRLTGIASTLISSFPLDKLQTQIDGDVTLQLPTEVILSGLTIRRSKAENNHPDPLKEKFPQEYDLDRINAMVAQVREKLREEEKAVPRVHGQ